MRRVIIESPYMGKGATIYERAQATARNVRFLQACMHDCLMRGEAPFASQGLYTQPGVLDDSKPEEREHGIRAGFAWREVAEATVVYTNLGMSSGMEYGILNAHKMGCAIEFRMLPEDWDQP